ncbi:MAG: GLPGLI family protein [Flavobacteriaceae bacterium]
MINKIKTNSFIILFLLSLTCYSQELSGEVIYKYSVKESLINNEFLNKNDDKRSRDLAKFLSESLLNNADIIQFTLVFNKEESFYAMNEMLTLDNDRGNKLAISLTGGNQEIYLNTHENKKLWATDTYGNFIVESEIDNFDWKITNETKQIMGYQCYKSTGLISNKKYPDVVAWFTTQIPVNFGPKGYAGLPGLILELEEGQLIYYASKIKLNPKKKITIKRPEKGEIVSAKEYDSIGKIAQSRFIK